MNQLVIGTLLAGALAFPAAAQVTPAPVAQRPAAEGVSPALCGASDAREPGIQGDVPAGQAPSYNCGVSLVGQLPIGGKVQGVGKCAYLRQTGSNEVLVIDVSDPAKPHQVRSVPVHGVSETMRLVVAKDRAILVTGNSVYDVKDCMNPVHLGEVKWPPLIIGAAAAEGNGEGPGQLPHDLRINRSATKIYASLGLWEADITNLNDPSSWKVTDYRCDLAPQIPGPWQEIHRQGQASGYNLCDDAANPKGAAYSLAASRLQSGLIWPSISHSLDANADGTRLYVGDQKVVGRRNLGETPKVRIIDLTQRPLKIIGVADGPGHGLDWFHAGGHDYVLGSNEWGSSDKQVYGSPGDTCQPYPRPTALGWGFEGIVSDVTDPAQARNVSMLQIAINKPEFCEARKASGRDPWIAYHLIDNPLNARFAAVNFGDAGLRIFDIRDPLKPSEVAYFNHGALEHGGIGAYDAARGLIYVAGESNFWVLKVEPQVKARLGL